MSFHVVVPAYNEAANLETCIQTLTTLYPYPQNTITVAADSKDLFPGSPLTVWLTHLTIKYNVFFNISPIRRGKGGAIKEVLLPQFPNAIIDADLAVNPYNLSPMLELLKQRGGLVIAKRTATNRTLTRTFTSKLYNGLTRLLFRTGVSDHQCGCKLLSPETVAIAENVHSNGFFFDTELIIRCKKAGLPITEYPVMWTEHKQKSTVNILHDGAKMFWELIKLRAQT